LRNDGTLVAWGNNSYGQTNAPALINVKLIAAGGYQGLVSIFSPLVQYQVDVTKDLLLIYNSGITNNSGLTNSAFVKDYYLANRPLVSGANVLAIDCSNAETIDPLTFTNQILTPFLRWLATNPTKHPQYIILFPDIPSAVCVAMDCINGGNSVSYGLSTNLSGIQPFITSINMGLFDATNDCIHYIDKLKSFGTNSQVVISASTRGYGNTNFVLDNVRKSLVNDDWSPFGSTISTATNALLAVGVQSAAIYYADGLDTVTNSTAYPGPHIASATNVAAYICWGQHSFLGDTYPTNGAVSWSSSGGWWIIETIESWNGLRENSGSGQGFFLQWFSQNAFGGSNYSNTPVGAVSHVYEPGLAYVNDSSTYFGLWASGKSFAISAWNSRRTPYFQAVGDPLAKR